MKRLLTAVFALAFSMSAMAIETVEVVAKKAKYNEFLFKQPFVTALFSPATAQSGKTVIMNDNKNFLFKIKEGWDEPIQLFVVMRDGTRKRFNLIPNGEMSDGAVWPNNMVANLRSFDEPKLSPVQEKQYFIDLLKELYEAKPNANGMVPGPAGFSEAKADDVIYYGPVIAQEIKRLSNTVHRISVYHVSSDVLLNITAADFYHDGVVLVELNHDIVGPDGIEVLVVSKEPVK